MSDLYQSQTQNHLEYATWCCDFHRQKDARRVAAKAAQIAALEAEVGRLQDVHDSGVRRLREVEAERESIRTDFSLHRHVCKEEREELLVPYRALAEAMERHTCSLGREVLWCSTHFVFHSKDIDIALAALPGEGK